MNESKYNMTPAELSIQYVYRKGDTVFLPHYTEIGLFVGPGYPRFAPKTYTGNELLDAGCTLDEMWLLKRRSA